MKNKIILKKYLIISLIASLILVICFFLLNRYQQNQYRVNFNNKIEAIVSLIKEDYPDLSEMDIIKILNSDEVGEKDIFSKYGIDINKESVVLKNDRLNDKYIIANIIFIIGAISAVIVIFILYSREKDKAINEITETIIKINNKNYELNVDNISEDELSILKSEIYKTTIFLKEAAENSINDKINLKKSLEDISHQIKTPLTSILIMLDSLIEDRDLDTTTGEEFIKEIRRNIININYLIKNLLKLSKIDSNTIEFKREKVDLNEVIEDSVKNIESLSDLHNVGIEFEKVDGAIIAGDYRWQVEALSNIIKNSVENSYEGSKVLIKISTNNIYIQLDITDTGKGIDKKDLPHIFKRFYKGEHSSDDGIGIGLALAKSIIEENGDKISVESSEKGTTFTIRYFGSMGE
ncbi:MAG: sensor histidine kinase [Lachnospiraceae bacterium]|jgi:signal transduction histidine kinase